MNSLDFLKQAKLADSLGHYKLADSLLEKAKRLAATPPPTTLEPAIDAILREALDKAAKAATDAEARKALLEAGLSEETIDSLARKAGGIRNINNNTIINEGLNIIVERGKNSIFVGTGSDRHQVTLSNLNLNQLLAILNDDLVRGERNRLIDFIRRYLNRRRSETIPNELAAEINTSRTDYTKPRPERPRPEPTPETPSETPTPESSPETPISDVPLEESGEGIISKLRNRFKRKPSEELIDLPKQKSKVMKWAKGLGAAGLAALGLYLYGNKLVDKNGKEINYLDPDLNKLGIPDDTMYKARTEAGQQQAQEPKALEFIEKHKNNPAIKDQRDWYNLALQEGKKESNDPKTVKNFANDVIAIIKKSDPKTQGFNAGRNA